MTKAKNKRRPRNIDYTQWHLSFHEISRRADADGPVADEIKGASEEGVGTVDRGPI